MTPAEQFKNAPELPEEIQHAARQARDADRATAEARGLFWAAIRRGDAAAAERLEAELEKAEAKARKAWRDARRKDIENGEKRVAPE